MKTDKKVGGARQKYEKPLLRTIELIAEEVLVVGCKTTSGTAVNNPACGVANRCNHLGS
ncbi:MAG TPA: hypothetical protein VMB78_05280 [Dissulfurispiraceae bacterium]|nr:hypothetical protein [Dissulfurispiraceae bacterium]